MSSSSPSGRGLAHLCLLLASVAALFLAPTLLDWRVARALEAGPRVEQVVVLTRPGTHPVPEREAWSYRFAVDGRQYAGRVPPDHPALVVDVVRREASALLVYAGPEPRLHRLEPAPTVLGLASGRLAPILLALVLGLAGLAWAIGSGAALARVRRGELAPRAALGLVLVNALAAVAYLALPAAGVLAIQAGRGDTPAWEGASGPAGLVALGALALLVVAGWLGARLERASS
jgi:hypothetical protein